MKQDSVALLKNSLKRLAGSVIYSRGMGYYRSGHVESLRVFLFGSEKNKIEIRGEIDGTRDYKASLEFDLQKMKFNDSDCTCPCDFDCKHSVALGLKFIDLFQGFLNQADESYREINIDGLKKKLVNWINNQDLAKDYAFDEYDEERDYEIERDGEEDDEIIDGEFEDVESYYKNQTKEELMNELTDAISLGDAPQDVIDRLIRAIADKGMDEKVKKKNAVIPSTLPRTPAWQYVRKNFNAEKYYIVIKINYNNKISSVEIRKNNHVFMEPGIFLQDYDDLTKTQEELFKFLESVNFYYDISNYEKLFRLLRDSGIKIFFEKKSNTSELIFVKEQENDKNKN